eukprot:CAMPEP_0171088518 /NCGR_PEP_ID=MMETSP0766_2-20121228/20831_1 /TAXON_ID=439317 /ORGANISM="Gambierdiscus australes, Strain CAWD 149" /LENGTH=55 /DNA_ID=CAMNT_0011546321 /DNA_START=880 /DNA_END=1043 /DNA_ORIENTATION=-
MAATGMGTASAQPPILERQATSPCVPKNGTPVSEEFALAVGSPATVSTESLSTES